MCPWATGSVLGTSYSSQVKVPWPASMPCWFCHLYVQCHSQSFTWQASHSLRPSPYWLASSHHCPTELVFPTLLPHDTITLPLQKFSSADVSSLEFAHLSPWLPEGRAQVTSSLAPGGQIRVDINESNKWIKWLWFCPVLITLNKSFLLSSGLSPFVCKTGVITALLLISSGLFKYWGNMLGEVGLC